MAGALRVGMRRFTCNRAGALAWKARLPVRTTEIGAF